MSNKKPLKTVPGTASEVKKSKGFIHNATDTFHELFLIFIGVIVIGGLLYSIFEKGASFFDGVWWALVTAFTVGYGDTVPETTAGRVVGVAIMSLTVFVIIPLITARMASKMIVNDDAWTNDEQQSVHDTNKRLNAYLDTVEGQKASTKRNDRAVPPVSATPVTVKRGRGRPRKYPKV